jgi:hypothetical protein
MSELEIHFQEIWDNRNEVKIVEALLAFAHANKHDVSSTIHSWNDWRAVENFKSKQSSDPILVVG